MSNVYVLFRGAVGWGGLVSVSCVFMLVWQEQRFKITRPLSLTPVDLCFSAASGLCFGQCVFLLCQISVRTLGGPGPLFNSCCVYYYYYYYYLSNVYQICIKRDFILRVGPPGAKWAVG